MPAISRNKGPRIFGYVRVSRSKQKTALQRDAMKAAKVDKIFQDKVSGTVWSRKALDQLLKAISPGDKLAVWRIDRLGRSAIPILQIADELEKKGASIVSLTEGCDTGTEQGRTFFMFLAVIADLEHKAIRKRTKAGVEAAIRRGSRFGSKPKLTPEQVRKAKQMMLAGRSALQTAAQFNVSRATLFRNFHARSGGTNRSS